MRPGLPYNRSAQAARANTAKARLLPIPRAVGDQLALQAHLSLAALRNGVEDIRLVHSVTEVALLARFLAEAGHGEVSHEMMLAAIRAMTEVHANGTKAGKYAVPSRAAFSLLAAIVSMYDQQLQTAPLFALTDASERLQHLLTGAPNSALRVIRE